MEEGDEVELEIATGVNVNVKMSSKPPPDADGKRQVIMEINGERWFIPVTDQSAVSEGDAREKATGVVGAVGAPMAGVVVDVKAKPGEKVKEGEPLLVLSAMKMETVVAAPVDGKVAAMPVGSGDDVQAGDLLVTIVPPDVDDAAA